MSIVYSESNEYEKVSRYQILRTITEDGKDRYLETYNQKFIPEKDDDIYHLVKVSEENRLDIISNQYYGSPTYWWAIALANKFIDPFIVSPGTMIRIPSMSEIVNTRNEILYRRRS